MLIHPWDAGSRAEALDFLRENEFGHLIAAGAGRDVPVVVPTQFLLADEHTALLHLARRNPVWHAIDENPAVMLVVSGDWVFIPGGWKKIPSLGEDRSHGIPTTFYASVQLICQAAPVDDEIGIVEILRMQIERLDPEGGLIDPAAHGWALNGTRGLRLAIQEIRAKFKYGGNLDETHRRHIAELLAQTGGYGTGLALKHLWRRIGNQLPANDSTPTEGGVLRLVEK
jgi:transcriptional regulator